MTILGDLGTFLSKRWKFLASDPSESREKRMVSLTKRAAEQGKIKEYNAQIASLQADMIECETKLKEIDEEINRLVVEIETTSGAEQTNRKRWLAKEIANKKKIMQRAKALSKQIVLIQNRIIQLRKAA